MNGCPESREKGAGIPVLVRVLRKGLVVAGVWVGSWFSQAWWASPSGGVVPPWLGVGASFWV